MIRAFEPKDKETYLAMARDFYSGDAALFQVNDRNFEKTFEACIHEVPSVKGYALLDETDTMVGYALLALYWSCEAGGMVVQLEELYLGPKARGKGFGSAFMEWLDNTYGSEAARFRLEVCPHNQRVKKLYERYGFEELPYIQMIKEPR